ncbi:phenoloxidase-activating factor 2-like [Epargyreus clarus]
MVALLKQSPNQAWSEDDYIGGGTLIHPSVVLTVAHKVDTKDPAELKCRAGEWDTQTEMEILPHQERNVQKIILHEDFFQLRAHFDAALLILESPFLLKDAYHIGVACLGRDLPSPGTLCYSMGWGRSFNNTNNAVLLKKIQLPLVDPAVCQRQLRNTRLGSNYLLHHTLMCAGGETGVDTCVGDGGASLVCPLKVKGEMTRYAVYGMVAYGVGCGVKDVPGVYAKVPFMVEWVNQKMSDEGLSRTYVF